MLVGYFSSQTVTPTNVIGAQHTYSDSIVSIPSSANLSRMNEHAIPPYTPPVPPRSTMAPIGHTSDEMFYRYVQQWQNRQRPVGPFPQSGQTRSAQSVRSVAVTGPTGPHNHVAPNQHNASTSTQPNYSSNFDKMLVEYKNVWLTCLEKILECT